MRSVWLDLTTGEPVPRKRYPPRNYKRTCEWEPATVLELMERAGPLAKAARAYVEAGAVTHWMLRNSKATRDAIAAAGLADDISGKLFLARQARQYELGWPILSEKSAPDGPALYGYPPDYQCAARLVADQIHALWEAVGRPHLDADRCKQAYRLLVRDAGNGLIGPLPPYRQSSASR